MPVRGLYFRDKSCAHTCLLLMVTAWTRLREYTLTSFMGFAANPPDSLHTFTKRSIFGSGREALRHASRLRVGFVESKLRVQRGPQKNYQIVGKVISPCGLNDGTTSYGLVAEHLER